MDDTTLIEKIHTAFSNIPTPTTYTLQIAHAHHQRNYNTEHLPKETATHWQEVPESDLKQYNTSLFHLDIASFVFYLPAYMCAYLENWQDNTVIDVADHVLFNLDPHTTDPSIAKLQAIRFETLTDHQKQTCGAFVKFCRDHIPENLAYDTDAYAEDLYASFWHRFNVH